MTCWLFHEWSAWSIIARGEQRYVDHPQHVLGFYVSQERRCARCGKTQLRTVVTE